MGQEYFGAVVLSSEPLLYTHGADTGLDRPAHVRAGSGLAPTRDGIALIQDDANFVAIVDPRTARARAITLPAGHEGRRQFDAGRGNKAHKLDLEACFSVTEPDGTLLVALGSGSKRTVPRENVVQVRWCESALPHVSVTHAPLLYEGLRHETSFAGSELNIEGAVFLGDRVRLFNRGNGKAGKGLAPVNASCDLDWPALLAHLRDSTQPPPAPRNVVRYELGALDGIPLGVTDATLWRNRILYSAAAEDSPDVYDDGPVRGSAIGVIDAEGGVTWAPVTIPDGSPFRGKVEGILPVEGRDDRLYVVVDSDDPAVASQLCVVELRLEGLTV